MTRGKRLVSPAAPLPSSAAGFAGTGRDHSLGKRFGAAPAMSVAAAEAAEPKGVANL